MTDFISKYYKKIRIFCWTGFAAASSEEEGDREAVEEGNLQIGHGLPLIRHACGVPPSPRGRLSGTVKTVPYCKLRIPFLKG